MADTKDRMSRSDVGQGMLREEEVAARLAVAPSTVRVWRQRKVGPPWVRVPFGLKGLIRYPSADFEAWVRDHQNGDRS